MQSNYSRKSYEWMDWIHKKFSNKRKFLFYDFNLDNDKPQSTGRINVNISHNISNVKNEDKNFQFLNNYAVQHSVKNLMTSKKIYYVKEFLYYDLNNVIFCIRVLRVETKGILVKTKI